jgi:hypothetical protein
MNCTYLLLPLPPRFNVYNNFFFFTKINFFLQDTKGLTEDSSLKEILGKNHGSAINTDLTHTMKGQEIKLEHTITEDPKSNSESLNVRYSFNNMADNFENEQSLISLPNTSENIRFSISFDSSEKEQSVDVSNISWDEECAVLSDTSVNEQSTVESTNKEYVFLTPTSQCTSTSTDTSSTVTVDESTESEYSMISEDSVDTGSSYDTEPNNNILGTKLPSLYASITDTSSNNIKKTKRRKFRRIIVPRDESDDDSVDVRIAQNQARESHNSISTQVASASSAGTNQSLPLTYATLMPVETNVLTSMQEEIAFLTPTRQQLLRDTATSELTPSIGSAAGDSDVMNISVASTVSMMSAASMESQETSINVSPTGSTPVKEKSSLTNKTSTEAHEIYLDAFPAGDNSPTSYSMNTTSTEPQGTSRKVSPVHNTHKRKRSSSTKTASIKPQEIYLDASPVGDTVARKKSSLTNEKTGHESPPPSPPHRPFTRSQARAAAGRQPAIQQPVTPRTRKNAIRKGKANR